MHSLRALVIFSIPFTLGQLAFVRASGVTNDSSVANGKTFDYIVVGAGLAGTTVAARLAEIPTLKILVVEAGGDGRADPNVYDIYNYKVAFQGPLDWAWNTDQGKLIHGYVHSCCLFAPVSPMFIRFQWQDVGWKLLDQRCILDARAQGSVRRMVGPAGA